MNFFICHNKNKTQAPVEVFTKHITTVFNKSTF